MGDSTRKIKLVCGRLCSGKDFIINRHYKRYDVISVSDIVKSIVESNDRAILQDTKHLDSEIIEQLKVLYSPRLVINGIRQMSIISGMLGSNPAETVEVVWVCCPEDVRRDRYYDREDVKDSQLTFEEADESDSKLGLLQIESYILNNLEKPYVELIFNKG